MITLLKILFLQFGHALDIWFYWVIMSKDITYKQPLITGTLESIILPIRSKAEK